MLFAALALTVAGQEITIRGRLARTVESGGWLIITEKGEQTGKYLLLNPQLFQKESWFRVGVEVEAAGEVKNDVMTIYQEGTAFEARTMRSIGKAANSRRHRRRRAR
ncbi:MAG: hypothetical protein QOJ64_3687 [Acidobacteriota bacterium]|jgi:hypothetical protein|nr:hypothetical protein [Acidobacteriota bacterium]